MLENRLQELGIIIAVVLASFASIASFDKIPYNYYGDYSFIHTQTKVLAERLSQFDLVPAWNYAQSEPATYTLPDYFHAILYLATGDIWATYEIALLLAMVFGSLFMYLLVSRFTSNWYARVFAPIFYAFSPYFLGVLPNYITLTADVVLLPLTYLGVELLLEKRTWRTAAIAGIVAGLNLSIGPQLFYTSLPFVTVFLIVRTIEQIRKSAGEKKKELVSSSIRIAIFWSIAVLVFLPFVLVFINAFLYAGPFENNHLAYRPLEHLQNASARPFEALSGFSIDTYGWYSSYYGLKIDFLYYFLSIIPVMLALVYWPSIFKNDKRVPTISLSILAVVSFLASFGPTSPFEDVWVALQRNLPFFNYVDAPGRFITHYVLASSILGGIATGHVVELVKKSLLPRFAYFNRINRRQAAIIVSALMLSFLVSYSSVVSVPFKTFQSTDKPLDVESVNNALRDTGDRRVLDLLSQPIEGRYYASGTTSFWNYYDTIARYYDKPYFSNVLSSFNYDEVVYDNWHTRQIFDTSRFDQLTKAIEYLGGSESQLVTGQEGLFVTPEWLFASAFATYDPAELDWSATGARTSLQNAVTQEGLFSVDAVNGRMEYVWQADVNAFEVENDYSILVKYKTKIPCETRLYIIDSRGAEHNVIPDDSVVTNDMYATRIFAMPNAVDTVTALAVSVQSSTDDWTFGCSAQIETIQVVTLSDVQTMAANGTVTYYSVDGAEWLYFSGNFFTDNAQLQITRNHVNYDTTKNAPKLYYKAFVGDTFTSLEVRVKYSDGSESVSSTSHTKIPSPRLVEMELDRNKVVDTVTVTLKAAENNNPFLNRNDPPWSDTSWRGQRAAELGDIRPSLKVIGGSDNYQMKAPGMLLVGGPEALGIYNVPSTNASSYAMFFGERLIKDPDLDFSDYSSIVFYNTDIRDITNLVDREKNIELWQYADNESQVHKEFVAGQFGSYVQYNAFNQMTIAKYALDVTDFSTPVQLEVAVDRTADYTMTLRARSTVSEQLFAQLFVDGDQVGSDMEVFDSFKTISFGKIRLDAGGHSVAIKFRGAGTAYIDVLGVNSDYDEIRNYLANKLNSADVSYHLVLSADSYVHSEGDFGRASDFFTNSRSTFSLPPGSSLFYETYVPQGGDYQMYLRAKYNAEGLVTRVAGESMDQTDVREDANGWVWADFGSVRLDMGMTAIEITNNGSKDRLIDIFSLSKTAKIPEAGQQYLVLSESYNPRWTLTSQNTNEGSVPAFIYLNAFKIDGEKYDIHFQPMFSVLPLQIGIVVMIVAVLFLKNTKAYSFIASSVQRITK